LSVAAIRLAPKVSWYEAITRGAVALSQKWAQPIPAERKKMVERGSNTRMLR
jgi:hypothetical protein